MIVFWLRYRVEFGLIQKVWRNLLPPYSRTVLCLDRRQSRMTELCPGRFARLPRRNSITAKVENSTSSEMSVSNRHLNVLEQRRQIQSSETNCL